MECILGEVTLVLYTLMTWQENALEILETTGKCNLAPRGTIKFSIRIHTG